MTRVTVPEAQQQLPQLLAAAQAGESVEIHAENGGTFRLLANRARPPKTGVPRAGTCAGLIEFAADFDAPLDELREYME